MTIEEFKTIKWRMCCHMACKGVHYATYESVSKFFKISAQTETTIKRNGEPGKSTITYLFNGKPYKTKEDLINAINALKGGEN